jgi:hypothetical protein
MRLGDFWLEVLMKLRVLAITAALVVLTAAPGFAQSNFSAGVKGGVNFANLSFDPEQEGCCDSKTGFIGGLFVTAPISSAVSIQPEFLYSMVGAKSEFDDFDAEIDFRQFQIPILIRADFGSGGAARPFVVFGPSIGFKLSAKEKFEDEEDDLDDSTESIDWGFTIGAGVQFGRGSIEGRYTHGLNNLNKGDEGEDLTVKSRVFAVLAGFRF